MSLSTFKDTINKILVWRPKIAALLGATIIIMIGIFIHDFLEIRNEGIFTPRHSERKSNIIKRLNSDPTPELIRPWMTFEYINSVFHLPAYFLAERLTIQDPKYPKISVGSLAHKQKTAPQALIEDVKIAVDSYPDGAQ